MAISISQRKKIVRQQSKMDLKDEDKYYPMPLAEIFQKIRFPYNKFMKFVEIAIFGLFNYKLLENLTCWENSAARFVFSVKKSIRFTYYLALCNRSSQACVICTLERE